MKPLRIIFMGTPDFSVPSLQRLYDDGYDIAAVYTQPDKQRGRGKKVTYSAVKDYRHRLWQNSAQGRARYSAVRLSQCPWLAASEVSRCRTDSICD